MSVRAGLRWRLTFLVTAVFAFALVLSTLVVTRVVENRLVADSRASAEALLRDYLDSVYGGVAAIGIVDDSQSTQFFYLSEAGAELSPAEYYDTLINASAFDLALPSIGSEALIRADTIADAGDIVITQFDSESGEALLPEGTTFEVSVGPMPVGEPAAVDRGDDVVAVSQVLQFGDGSNFTVGVSRPLQPVTDSLDAVRRALWFAVPALIAAIALATWAATSRSLRPVRGITDQAQAITAQNIGDRVPVPETNDEIQVLATTVNAMLDRLDASQRQKRQLVADASHELRSPVAASRAQLEVAQANPNETNWLEMVDLVLAEQASLANLIDGLVALSRLDEAGSGAHQEVDLVSVIEAEAARHCRITHSFIGGEAIVLASTDLLTRAVRNLVDNALRHATDRVELSIDRGPGTIVLNVDDDGPGVPTEQREAIFDRFTRLDEARDRDRGGAGLGLAIAREVATAHAGTLAVTDGPLGGARFSLRLPI